MAFSRDGLSFFRCFTVCAEINDKKMSVHVHEKKCYTLSNTRNVLFEKKEV